MEERPRQIAEQSTRKLQTLPIFSLIWSMAALIASNGRIVFSPAAGIRAARMLQQGSPYCRALKARRQNLSARSSA
jgi:hypothetical protein